MKTALSTSAFWGQAVSSREAFFKRPGRAMLASRLKTCPRRKNYPLRVRRRLPSARAAVSLIAQRNLARPLILRELPALHFQRSRSVPRAQTRAWEHPRRSSDSRAQSSPRPTSKALAFTKGQRSGRPRFSEVARVITWATSKQKKRLRASTTRPPQLLECPLTFRLGARQRHQRRALRVSVE